MRSSPLHFLLLILFTVACQPEQSDEADVAAIRAMTKAWEAAIQAEDVPALLDMCTDNIVVPMGRGSSHGRSITGTAHRVTCSKRSE